MKASIDWWIVVVSNGFFLMWNKPWKASYHYVTWYLISSKLVPKLHRCSPPIDSHHKLNQNPIETASRPLTIQLSWCFGECWYSRRFFYSKVMLKWQLILEERCNGPKKKVGGRKVGEKVKEKKCLPFLSCSFPSIF